MSRRIDPASVEAEQQKVSRRVERAEVSTPRVQAIKDDAGNVRVRFGLIAGRYGVRVYNLDGSVAYDFTVTP